MKPPFNLDAPADRAMAQAREAGELRHLEYVATLDPRERAVLAPWTVNDEPRINV